MWVFTQHGFLSIVRHRDQADRYLVRARVRGDLQGLLRLSGIRARVLDNAGTDYPFRAVVTAAELGALFDALEASIDYPNFKARVAQTQGAERAHVYERIWGILGDALGWARSRASDSDRPRKTADDLEPRELFR